MTAQPWSTGPCLIYCSVPIALTNLGTFLTPAGGYGPVSGPPDGGGGYIPFPPGDPENAQEPAAGAPEKAFKQAPPREQFVGGYVPFGPGPTVPPITGGYTAPSPSFQVPIPRSYLPNLILKYVPVFFGFSKHGMTIHEKKGRRPVYTSASPDEPENIIHTGNSALITGVINFYDEKVYAIIGQNPNNLPRGWIATLDVGTTLITRAGLGTGSLYLYFPYSAKAQFGGLAGRVIPPRIPPSIAQTLGIGGFGSTHISVPQTNVMPEGYRFRQALLVSPERRSAGVRATELHLSWLAVRSKPPTSPMGFIAMNGVMALYDHNMTDLLGLAQVT